VRQVVIFKVISFDDGLDGTQAVGGRFLSLQRPGMNIRSCRVGFVFIVTGFTASTIISRFSCVIRRIGVGRNVSMDKRYICKFVR
jgi:hypothetical protein